MKKTIITLLLFFVLTKSFATDRIVQENGAVGTFATITDAINAASDGDRIIIFPKIGGNAYIENIIINKSLEFATAEDTVRYKIQGNITIEPVNERIVTIIGANLVSGNITGTGSTGWRTNVNILGCILGGGNISFSNQFYAKIVSNIIENGGISISHGAIIGNDIVQENNRIFISNSTSISNDTINIIANKTTQIVCTSNIFLNIYNNFIRRVNSTTTNFASIEYSFVSVDTTKMNIINNTILNPAGSTSGSNNYYLKLSSPAIIKNTIFQRIVTPNSITSNLSFFILAANTSSSNNYYFTSNVRISNSPTEVNLTTSPINISTASLVLPTLAQNGSDPSFEYYDLDLTQGDAGCYGGSYSFDNYFPITGSARVYNIDMPFGITTTGAPLNIKADGFDR
jgi:hypothetical protein